ncbi:hypothetical protein WME75_01520 [Sorangium sp. So ce1014]|uniref:hypothetical protein n=1 Tax=Sorangium sp. So ce1014 TaxID=3133326 RepID=UPI003F5D8C94
MDNVDDMQPQTAEVWHGAAQSPRTQPWKPAHGGPRTLDEAIQIARRNSITISEDVFFVVADDLVPPDAYALWCVVQAHGSMRWENFYARGRIPVKIRQAVLESDEAIVAVFAHETYEIEGLRKLFEHREAIPGAEIIRLIRTGIRGNLHDQAWDYADLLVAALREEAR